MNEEDKIKEITPETFKEWQNIGYYYDPFKRMWMQTIDILKREVVERPEIKDPILAWHDEEKVKLIQEIQDKIQDQLEPLSNEVIELSTGRTIYQQIKSNVTYPYIKAHLAEKGEQ